jgi:GGDEF domain-containing protein
VILADPFGRELIRKTNPSTYDVVPQWFTELLPMSTATEATEVSSGWQNGGTLTVIINPGIGYLKLVIGSLSTRLDHLSHDLYADELTGLNTRATFDTDVKEKLMPRGHGFVFIIHLDDLSQFANSRGDEVTDRLLAAFADCLRGVSKVNAHATVTAYRFHGAEFALVLRKAFHYLQQDVATHGLAVNISSDSVADVDVGQAHFRFTPVVS